MFAKHFALITNKDVFQDAAIMVDRRDERFPNTNATEFVRRILEQAPKIELLEETKTPEYTISMLRTNLPVTPVFEQI